MKVKVKFFTTLREITQKKEETIDLPKPATVEDLLKVLSERYGRGFKEYVYSKAEKVQPYLQFLVNGRSTLTLQGFKTKLENGDEVAILPPVGGG
jgi:molybdopterin synthase sulfur carrier subunit